MSDIQKDPLSPADKDPVEGARGPDEGADPGGDLESGHLGEGGDPVEGERKD